MSTIEYDPVKDAENRRKHLVPLALAELMFDGPFIEAVDDRHDYGETRFIATGPIAVAGDRIFVVVYTWRNGARRIINVRKANDREVRRYRSGVA